MMSHSQIWGVQMFLRGWKILTQKVKSTVKIFFEAKLSLGGFFLRKFLEWRLWRHSKNFLKKKIYQKTKIFFQQFIYAIMYK